MPNPLSPLTIDFLDWLADGPRPYCEVMDAWRTSCPKLTIWEDALDGGLVVRRHVPGEPATVGLADAGTQMLKTRRPVGGTGFGRRKS